MDTEKRNILVVDLDGTLADDEPRAEKYLRGPEGKQWPEYFAAAKYDKPKYPIVQLVQLLRFYGGKSIWIISGRSDSVLGDTLTWLNENNVPYDRIILRPQDNRTDDNIWKLQVVKAWGIEDRIWMVLEDRQRMVDAWREAGFTCLQVAPGKF